MFMPIIRGTVVIQFQTVQARGAVLNDSHRLRMFDSSKNQLYF